MVRGVYRDLNKINIVPGFVQGLSLSFFFASPLVKPLFMVLSGMLCLFLISKLKLLSLSLHQAVRVTKPNIPESIRRNYELMQVSFSCSVGNGQMFFFFLHKYILCLSNSHCQEWELDKPWHNRVPWLWEEALSSLSLNMQNDPTAYAWSWKNTDFPKMKLFQLAADIMDVNAAWTCFKRLDYSQVFYAGSVHRWKTSSPASTKLK